MITLLPDSVTQNERRSSLSSIIFKVNNSIPTERLETRFPYDDQDFREKYTPGHVSQPSLKYTGDESKGPRAANASLKNNHPVFIFSHHDSDGSQNLFLCEEKNVSFYTFYRTTFYRQTLVLPSRERPLNPAYLCSLAFSRPYLQNHTKNDLLVGAGSQKCTPSLSCTTNTIR